MPFRHASALALALLLPGCDPADPSETDPIAEDDDAPPEEEPNGDPVDVEAEVAASHALVGAIEGEGQTSASIVTEAVFLASQMAGTGQIVTNGTLTQESASFGWAPTPADHMVVEFSDGTTVELWVGEIEGDPSSASAFLEGEHRLAYRVAVEDRIDMEFTSVRQAGTMAASGDGTYVHDGREYEVALDLAGTYDFEVDTTGSHFRDEHRTEGSIAAAEFELDVDESWFFELVTSEGESAQATRRTIASSLRIEGDVYDWVDVEMRKSFRDGRPSELDTYWAAEGEILRNGGAYGVYRLGSSSALDFITIVVELPDGAVELERHATY